MNVYPALFTVFLTFAIGSMVSAKTTGMVSSLPPKLIIASFVQMSIVSGIVAGFPVPLL